MILNKLIIFSLGDVKRNFISGTMKTFPAEWLEEVKKKLESIKNRKFRGVLYVTLLLYSCCDHIQQNESRPL